jgi:hypothetical protein
MSMFPEGCRQGRRKNIDNYDSYINYENQTITQLRGQLKAQGRNQFKLIPEVNYDQDSEEEWADLHGERLSESDKESDVESIARSAVEEGFIVGDDDFSSNSEDDETDPEAAYKKIQILFKRENRRRLNENRKEMTRQSKNIEIVMLYGNDEFKAQLMEHHQKFPI